MMRQKMSPFLHKRILYSCSREVLNPFNGLVSSSSMRTGLSRISMTSPIHGHALMIIVMLCRLVIVGNRDWAISIVVYLYCSTKLELRALFRRLNWRRLLTLALTAILSLLLLLLLGQLLLRISLLLSNSTRCSCSIIHLYRVDESLGRLVILVWEAAALVLVVACRFK